MKAVGEVRAGDGLIDTHEVGHPEIPVASVGVGFVGDDLVDTGPCGAVGDAGTGEPFPLELTVFVDPCALAADADDDALIGINRIGQEGIGRGNGDGLADGNTLKAAVGLHNVEVGNAYIPRDAGDGFAGLNDVLAVTVVDTGVRLGATGTNALLDAGDGFVQIEIAGRVEDSGSGGEIGADGGIGSREDEAGGRG